MRKHLNPSLVLSVVAVFIALGGTSYALTQLPKNSVGPKQIKKNAVNSAKVKDRSLLAKDFRKGQLPKGATGLAGAQGSAGPTGPPARPVSRAVRSPSLMSRTSATRTTSFRQTRRRT